jgi:putative intracellular protease/amidase
MRIAIPVYDGFTALDAVGPYEVLSRLPGAQVRWLAAKPGPVRTDNDMLGLVADAAYDPEPAFDAGSRGKAPSEIVERLLARSRG